MATRQSRAVATRGDKHQPVNMLAVIAKAAADPAVVPEKMRSLLDMQKEIAGEEARMAFTSDFIKMADELPIINATGRIEIREKVGGERTGRVQQSTPYATYNEIWRTIKPILAKYRFGLTHSNLKSDDGRVIIRSVLMHERGYERESIIPLPLETSGSKNNVQGYGSSTSYGKRYNTVQLLNLISEAPDDADTDGVTVISEAQFVDLMKMIEFKGADLGKFCKHFGIAQVADLPASKLNDAIAMLKLKKVKS